jgi:hypothetical protein
MATSPQVDALRANIRDRINHVLDTLDRIEAGRMEDIKRDAKNDLAILIVAESIEANQAVNGEMQMLDGLIAEIAIEEKQRRLTERTVALQNAKTTQQLLAKSSSNGLVVRKPFSR